jgi:hypothetical protein
MPTKTVKKSKPSKTEPVLKLDSRPWWQRYYDRIDFAEWYEEFVNATNKNGTPKFKTVHAFIKSKIKDNQKKRYKVLWWILGPKIEVGIDEVAPFDLPQFDWLQKRERGHWYSSENIDGLKNDVNRAASSIEQVAGLGKVNLEQISRLRELQKLVDQEYAQLFIPELSAKENQLRVRDYLSILERIQLLSSQAQEQFAKTKSVDMRNISEFLQMFGQSMQRQVLGNKAIQEEDKDAVGRRNIAGLLVDMVMKKAVSHELPLPDEAMKEIVLEKDQPKKRVN